MNPFQQSYDKQYPPYKKSHSEPVNPPVASGIQGVSVRLSQRGVPHMIVTVDGYEYSVCYFSKRNGPMYRVWYWEPDRDGEQTRLLDIPLVPGQQVDMVQAIRDEVIRVYV